MRYRPLGRTGIEVSVVSFGAGPVSGWVGSADEARQLAVVRRAVELGVNWFDTAATYGDGRSESSLGRTLREAGALGRVHLATKVRLTDAAFGDIRGFVRKSVEGSLARLGVERVTLLQLHNSITARRGDQPTSVTPDDVLGSGGVLEAFEELRAAGLVSHLGLTGLGDAPSLRRVLETGRFDTVQTPYNLLNPSAGRDMSAGVLDGAGGEFDTDAGADLSESMESIGRLVEPDYGDQFSVCRRLGMGVFAIRVFAGGALADREPSAHTRTTKFFPLDLYERDRARAARIASRLSGGTTLPETALRFVLAHPAVTSALIGFGAPDEIDDAARWSE